jgi:hypothetical protein
MASILLLLILTAFAVGGKFTRYFHQNVCFYIISENKLY